MNRAALLSVLLGLGASASGCVFESERAEPPVAAQPNVPFVATTGTLRLRWAIDGRKDPDECIKAEAANAEVSVVDRSGREVGAWQQPCGYFTMDVTLGTGTYTGSAVLLDKDGRPRTTRVNIETFSLRARDVLDIPVDFPASSFL